MEQTITFKLEDFEGPLDLLLYLVSKNKMNIYDIEIVALIDQYVSMVNGLPVYQMESASEFFAAQERRSRAHEGRTHRYAGGIQRL